MAEHPEDHQQPAECRKPEQQRHGKHHLNRTEHQQKHQPVRPAQEPAVIPLQTNRLRLRPQIRRHQNTRQRKHPDSPGRNLTGPCNRTPRKNTRNNKNIRIPVKHMIQIIPRRTCNTCQTGHRSVNRIKKCTHKHQNNPKQCLAKTKEHTRSCRCKQCQHRTGIRRQMQCRNSLGKRGHNKSNL